MPTRVLMVSSITMILILGFFITPGCQQLDSLFAPPSTCNYHLAWTWPQNDSIHARYFIPLQDKVFLINSEEGTHYKINDRAEIQWAFVGDSRTTSTPLVRDSIIYIPFKGIANSGEANAIIAIDTLEQFLEKFDFEYEFNDDPILSPDGSFYMKTPASRFSDRLVRMSPDGKSDYFGGAPDSSQEFSYSGIRLQGFDSAGNVIVYVPWEESVRRIAPDGKLLNFFITDGWPHVEKDHNDIIKCLACFIDDTLTIAIDASCNKLWSKRGKKYIDGDISHMTTSHDNSRLVIGNSNGKLYILNAIDGSIVNTIDLGVGFGPIDEIEWLQNDLVVASNSNNQLLVIDTAGTILWKTSLYFPGSPVVRYISNNGDIYITQDGQLLKYTTDTTQVTALPDPVPPPQSKEEAESEIVKYMLDDICQQIKAMGDFVYDDSDMPMPEMLQNASSAPSLILYANAKKSKGGLGDVSWKSLVKSWVYQGGQAIPQEDAEKTESGYRKKYVKDVGLFMPWTYEIYKFGILSLSPDFTEAEIALDNYCGGMCGHGSIFKLRRSPSGKWWTAKYTSTWIS
jgi:hypothetical protein